jgi:hypothetical protein
VIGGNNLREGLGLRRIRLMAADAEYGRIEFFGGHGSRIVRVLCQRSVAGLAIHMRVLAILLFFQDVGMAAFASLVPREIHWPGRDFRQCVAPIVSILSETFWDQKPPENQEQEDARDEDSGQSKKMSRILEGIHSMFVGKESLRPSVLCLSRQEETGTSRDTGNQSHAAVLHITVDMCGRSHGAVTRALRCREKRILPHTPLPQIKLSS